MNPKLEETIHLDFITSSPTTGAAADADATPTCEVFEDANDTAILSPTVTKRSGKTGNYRFPVACTAANGFEAGKSYNVIVTAMVGGVVSKTVAKNFQLRTYSLDDLFANVGVAGANLTALGDTRLANLNATVASRAVAGDAMALTSAERTTFAGVLWNALTSGMTVVGSIGKLIKDFLDVAISSRMATFTYTAPDNAGIASAKGVTDKLNTTLEADGANWRYTASALFNAPHGSNPTGNALFWDVWRYTTSAAPTASGAVRTDTSDWNAATKVQLNNSTLGGSDLTTYLSNIKLGDTIRLQQEDNANVWNDYQVIAAPPTSMGAWQNVSVLRKTGSSSTTPVNGKNCLVIFFREPTPLLTDTEKAQLRYQIGIDGTATAPSTAVPALSSQASVNSVNTKIGTPTNLGSGGASLAGNMQDIESQTDDIGPAGAGLTALGDTRLANLDAAMSSRATPAQVLTQVNGALNTAIPASPTADSINQRLKAMDDADIPAAVAAVDTKVAAVQNKTNALPPDPADASDLAASFATVNGKLDTINGKVAPIPPDPADASDIALAFGAIDSKLNTAAASDAAVKGVTDKLNTAMEADGGVYRFTSNALEMAPVGEGGGGGGGDPWNTNLPGSYPNGSAGQILGEYLDAKVSTRATQSSVDILLSRITSTLFSGITSLGQWLGLMAGKQTGDAVARAELRATGIGNGTYDETKHSLEEIREHGDEAWVGGGVIPPEPTPDYPCAQNPAQTRGPTTEPVLSVGPNRSVLVRK